MKLVSETKVREALRFDQMARTDAAIVAALHQSTQEIAGQLRTKFERADYEDTFLVRPGSLLQSRNEGVTTYNTVFALKTGFLTAAPEVTYASSLANLNSSPTTLTDDQYLATLEKGKVELFSQIPLAHMFVRIAYTAGFAVDGSDDELYTGVPDWLEQGAIGAGCAKTLTANPEFAGDKATAADFKSMLDDARLLLDSGVRYFPSALRPLN